MYRYFLFDLDGTLMDTLSDIHWALNTAMKEFGLKEIELSSVRQKIGNGLFELARKAVSDDSLGTLEMEEIVPKIGNRLKELYAGEPWREASPYPGVLELLTRLRQLPAAKIGLITNKPQHTAELVAVHFFPDIFDIVYGESPDKPRKPDPVTVRKTLELLGKPAGAGLEDCVLVGDSEVDIETAISSGCPHVAVLWGFRDRVELEEAGARTFAENAAELALFLLN